MDNYEKEILNKIDSGVKLAEHELKDLVYEFKKETKHGENRRWSRSNRTISRVGDRYFSTTWEEGLTESQPNEFYNQPIEVVSNTYEKTITVTEWIKKEETI